MNFASFIILSIFFGTALSKPFQLSTGEATESSQKPPYCTGKFDFDCGEDELRIRCISSLWTCDHVYDCSTGADEKCVYLFNCPSGFFMCLNGDCISAKKRCDGVKDCLDDSDERACFTMEKGTTPTNVLNSADSQYIADLDHIQQLINHQAEAIVGENKGSHGVSAITVIFFCIMVIGLALLSAYWALHRYPNAATRVDEVLKGFRPRNALPNRLLQSSSQSRVNIISPDNANNDQFFDNPMNIQQPLILNVAAPIGSASSHMQSPPSNAQ